MGRWAEVYFTAPPDKREQAVLELLRELQGEPEPASAAPAAFVRESSPRNAEAQASSLCPWCGRENPASHSFCGMCGKSVAQPAVANHADVRIADLHITDEEIADHLDPSSFDSKAPLREPVLRAETPALHSVSTQAGSYQARHTDEEPIFRRERDLERRDFDDEIFHYPPPSRPSGVFLGLALVVALLAIGYLVWRTYGAPQAHDAAQAPPAVAATEPATQPAPDSAPPTVSKPDVPEPTSPASQPTASSEAVRENERTGARNRGHKSAAEPIRSVAAAEKNPTPDASAGNGAEELATAQSYLNGASGQQRNRAEGAKWLWKAVSKHNADATLLLADLYLRGEGVGKSCDQAHVLLDAAARQGIKGAGDKLRHLQAFGCQ
jgi:hypothetical protein